MLSKKRGFKIDNRVLIVFVVQLIAAGESIEGFTPHALRFRSFWECIIPIIMVYYLLISNIRFRSIKPLVTIIGIILFWQILLIFRYGSYPILIGRIYDVLFAFIFIRSLGIEKFFFYFERSVAILSVIGLLLWLPIALFPEIRGVYEQFCFYKPNSSRTFLGTFGFFAFAGYGTEHEGVLIRNLGFAREPGLYSCFLVLAFLIHLIRNRFKLFKKNFWPLFLGILTSQSTTGYMSLFICFLGFFLNAKNSTTNKKIKLFLIIISITTLIYSPFMIEKMTKIVDSENFLTESAANYYAKIDKVYVPQRAEGLFLEALNIIDSPWVGYGDNPDYSYVKKVLFPNSEIVLSNGILQIFSMMGIPLALLLYYITYRSSSLIIYQYNLKGGFLLFSLICMVNVSYNFFFNPFFVTISLYYLYARMPLIWVFKK